MRQGATAWAAPVAGLGGVGSGAGGAGLWLCARAPPPEPEAGGVAFGPFSRRAGGGNKNWPLELLYLPMASEDGVGLLALETPGLPTGVLAPLVALAVGTRVRISHPAMDG